ncbi:MAG: TrkH family potassium uptake protein [Gemmobacter sp.]
MVDLRPVGYVIGLMLVALGLAMLLPLGLDLVRGDPNWRAFSSSAVISCVAGGVLALACANGATGGLTLQQSFILTTGSWVAVPAFGALPFMLGAPGVDFTDAMFEAMSGVTTTGATVFVGLDALPMGTNLWRGILHWLGGLGIVIVALIFLPVMQVGGMQFFRSEGFDTLGKVLPRAFDISRALTQIYIAMTVACMVAFFALGMPAFDAVVHALSAVSTGGFSTRDASFAGYSAGIEMAAVVFMILASLPFIRFIQLVQGDARSMFGDVQVRAYLRWIAYAVAAIVLHRVIVGGEEVLPALRQALFNVVSIFSGTGFTSADLAGWGPFALVVLMAVGFIGGCTSSTGCSVKVFRYLVMFEAIRAQVRRLMNPSAIAPLRLQGRRLEVDVVTSVMVFFTLFVLSFGGLAVALALAGLHRDTALTAAWTAIANVGPVFGPGVGPTGAMDGFPAAAKWLMIAGMLVGRLEILSVYVLFTARFWAR